MHRAPNTVLILDIYNNATMFAKDISGFLKHTSDPEAQGKLIAKVCNLSRDMVDDIVTENLFWTKDDTVAESDRYTKTLDILSGMEDEVRELFESYIVLLEGMISELDILPSWSYFEVMLKSQWIVIHRHGDYRIDDWMKRNKGKSNKVTRISGGG